LGAVPTARSGAPDSGVDCIACHVDTDAVIWSDGDPKYVPHWTRRSEIYSDGRFCTGCHASGKYSGVDCLECHMPMSEGAAADGPNIAADVPGTHRSHRWPGSSDPDMVAGAVSLEAKPDGGRIDVLLINHVSAHPFPATSHRKAFVVVVDGETGGVRWENEVIIPAGSNIHRTIDGSLVSGGTKLQLRYYPGPEIGSGAFHVVLEVPLP